MGVANPAVLCGCFDGLCKQLKLPPCIIGPVISLALPTSGQQQWLWGSSMSCCLERRPPRERWRSESIFLATNYQITANNHLLLLASHPLLLAETAECRAYLHAVCNPCEAAA